MKRALVTATILAAVAAATGCTETISSSDIRTHGIAAEFTVVADSDSSSTVQAVLRTGGKNSNTMVNLDNGDKLVAYAGDESKDMQVQKEGRYRADFSVGAADTEFKISLVRGEDDDGAPDTIGKLPKPFDLTVPSDSPSRKDDDIEIKWSNSGTGDKMELEIDGDCIFRFHKSSISDTGSYVIHKGELDSTGGNNPETCDLTVVLKRVRSGSVDSHLNPDSSFVLYQRRSATFTSKP